MVCINYNCYSLRKITKKSSENIMIKNDSEIREILNILIDKYGNSFKKQLFNPNAGKFNKLVLVNGKSVSTMDHIINNEDIINIISQITGG